MRSLFALLLAATAAFAGPQFLARVDLDASQTVEELPILPVMDLDGYCLVRTDAAGLSRLSSAGFKTAALAEVLPAALYYYVTPGPGFDRSRLSGLGTVLTEDSQGLVLATDESRLLDLNRLPVQLAGIPEVPITLGNPPAPATFPVAESLIQMLVDRVSADSVKASIQRLQDFYTRYSTTESLVAAVNWARERLEAYGCDSTALEHWRTDYAPNVIGVKLGRVNPRPIWVICGHIDNTSDSAPRRCPGSDDNASGTTAVLEACRAFQGIEFEQSVYFVAFSGEEQGLWGSDSFCRRAARRGDSVKAALNFDMISYGRQNRDSLDVIGKTANPACAWLVDSFIANARTYTTLKIRRRLLTNPQPNSDHASFLSRGWPAFCGIERDFTPAYHTLGDTIGPLYFQYCGTNNWLLATEATKAAVATIARFAGAYLPTGTAEPGGLTPPALVKVSPSIGPAPVRLALAGPPPAGTRLEVYSPDGRMLVSVPAVGRMLEWDGNDMSGHQAPAGIYLFRLIGPGFAQTGRAVLTGR
uniref:M28 family peptidase n=1 Tax=candidate division WOR-3 bacterium TaxID=2052148 RepID=A0A7C4CB63_UNCW3